MLAELRAAGFELMAAGGTLYVQPGSKLTAELRAVIRQRKADIMRELAAEAQQRMAEMGCEFADALRLGCLIVCSRCAAFAPRPGELPDGWCRRYSTEVWSSVPFTCPGFSGAH